MTGKLFIIEKANLEATAISLDDVLRKLNDVKFDFVSIHFD